MVTRFLGKNVFIYCTDEEEYYYTDVDDDSSQKLYTDACKEFRAKYMKLIYNQLTKETLSLLSVVLKPMDCKAFATALVVSKYQT